MIRKFQIRNHALKNSSPVVLIIGTGLGESGGVSTHMNMLLGSTLAKSYKLLHLDVGSRSEERPAAKLFRLALNPFRLAFILLVRRPVLVHINPSFDAKAFFRDAVSVLICKLFRKKVIIQFHGGQPDEFMGRWSHLQPAISCLLQCADKIIVLSESARESLADVVPDGRLTKFPNAVNTRDYIDRPRTQDNRNRDRIKILFLSRLIREKGVYEVLEAIPAVVREYPGVIFEFIGSGPAEKDLKTICRKRDLLKYVEFSGYLRGEEKVQSLRDADIFVFPTFHPEGFPYALGEAMAAGLPVITCDSGAISEFVQDGVNGFIIPAKNHRRSAETILHLIENPELRTKMGQLNQRIAAEQLDTEVVIGQYLNIYRAFTGTATVGDDTQYFTENRKVFFDEAA